MSINQKLVSIITNIKQREIENFEWAAIEEDPYTKGSFSGYGDACGDIVQDLNDLIMTEKLTIENLEKVASKSIQKLKANGMSIFEIHQGTGLEIGLIKEMLKGVNE